MSGHGRMRGGRGLYFFISMDIYFRTKLNFKSLK